LWWVELDVVCKTGQNVSVRSRWLTVRRCRRKTGGGFFNTKARRHEGTKGKGMGNATWLDVAGQGVVVVDHAS
jgi:hypothetical protein